MTRHEFDHASRYVDQHPVYFKRVELALRQSASSLRPDLPLITLPYLLDYPRYRTLRQGSNLKFEVDHWRRDPTVENFILTSEAFEKTLPGWTQSEYHGALTDVLLLVEKGIKSGSWPQLQVLRQMDIEDVEQCFSNVNHANGGNMVPSERALKGIGILKTLF